MTGYHLSIGYTPTRTDYDAMWEILKREARKVADNPVFIAAEARRLDCPETCEDGCCTIDGYAVVYAGPFEHGHPVKIVEDDPGNRQVMQTASTDKGFKYHIRRAYVRLLIEAMHRHGIEVNLAVV